MARICPTGQNWVSGGKVGQALGWHRTQHKSIRSVNVIYELEVFLHDSRVLRDNPLGDPHIRRVYVLSPKNSQHRSLPLIWMLAGFGGTGAGFLNAGAWHESLWDRVNRLAENGALRDVRIVLPDVVTSVGGSQYVDSSAIGPYDTYLWDELYDVLENRFPIGRHGVAGKSSGGFGAWTAVLNHPNKVDAMASHAGDALFEWAYWPDFPKAYQTFREEGEPSGFWNKLRVAGEKPSRWKVAINVMAMTAAYSPNGAVDGRFPADFPLDFDTLAVKPEVWARWLQHDPLRRLETAPSREIIKKLRLCFFDAGTRDEYQLQYAATRIHQLLNIHDIPHTYEQFAGGHHSTNHRYDVSLPLLAEALSKSV